MEMKDIKSWKGKLEYIWDIYIAWFLVNGRKQGDYWKKIKKKYS